ncbi:MAG: MFS transporter [Rhodospirillales bacterium]
MNVDVATADRRPAAEAWTLWLVSIGHGFSHFYMIALPPLFPLLHAEFGVSWTALGLIVALYSLISGAVQVPLGFWVDKFGARAILLAGFGLQALAIAACGLAPSYWPLLVLMLVAGLGNAVFHPADYAILSARIPDQRVGRAFGTHLFASYVGWMIGPPVMLALATTLGWRAALVIVGLAGLLYLAVMLWHRECLADTRAAAPRPAADGRKPLSGLALLSSRPVVLFFLFFLVLSIGGMGLQTFAVPSLIHLYGATLAEANLALTLFFVASGVGILAGGWLADRTARHDLFTAIAFVFGAVLVAAIGFPVIGIVGAIALMFLGGLCNAIVGPSRDVMVRNISPPGSVGAVFGFVTTGFSVGGAIGPLMFGWINDIGRPEWVFFVAAATFILSIAVVFAAQAARR